MKGRKYNCQVSLEERWPAEPVPVWVVPWPSKINNKALAYKRVCADGPVFNLEDVIWE